MHYIGQGLNSNCMPSFPTNKKGLEFRVWGSGEGYIVIQALYRGNIRIHRGYVGIVQ